jgi:hypothetical protein
VLGDSHAAMLNIFFDYLGKELGFKARIITASSCVTIPNFDYQRISEWAQKACLSQIEEAKKYLDTVDTIFLAASWSSQLQSEAFRYALDIFSEEINKGGTIYILSQEPLLNYHPQRSRRFEYLGVDASIGLDKRYLSANNLLRDLSASENKKIKFIELDEINLFKRTPYWNGELIFYDTHHINEVGAKEYAKQALPIISKELFYDQ